MECFLTPARQIQPLYVGVVALFRAFFKHHAGTVAPPRCSHGGGSASDEEADTSDDLLQASAHHDHLA